MQVPPKRQIPLASPGIPSEEGHRLSDIDPDLCSLDLLKRRDKIAPLIKRVQRLIRVTLISLLISAPYRDSRAVISGKREIYRLGGIGVVEKHPERLESVLINLF